MTLHRSIAHSNQKVKHSAKVIQWAPVVCPYDGSLINGPIDGHLLQFR